MEDWHVTKRTPWKAEYMTRITDSWKLQNARDSSPLSARRDEQNPVPTHAGPGCVYVLLYCNINNNNNNNNNN